MGLCGSHELGGHLSSIWECQQWSDEESLWNIYHIWFLPLLWISGTWCYLKMSPIFVTCKPNELMISGNFHWKNLFVVCVNHENTNTKYILQQIIMPVSLISVSDLWQTCDNFLSVCLYCHSTCLQRSLVLFRMCVVCQQLHGSHEHSRMFIPPVFLARIVSFQITKPGNVESV